MTEPTTPAGLLLSQALQIVEGARRADHGPPERTFGTIAAYWTTYLQSVGLIEPHMMVAPVDVCRMMELLKIARGSKLDDCLDSAGYAALAHEVQQ